MSEFPPSSLRYRGAVQRVSQSRRLVSPPTDGLTILLIRPTDPDTRWSGEDGKEKEAAAAAPKKATREGEDRQHFSTLGGPAHTCAVAVISVRLGL